MITRVTPTLSVAETAMLMLRETVAPFAGEVMAATGAVVSRGGLGSGLFTDTVTEADPTLFAAS